jgi:hypothetical protein
VGEAQRRRKRLSDLKEEWRNCCFCGGQGINEEWDHQPGKLLFPDKQRPKGLEFPACKRCNVLSKGDEAVVAFLARLGGSTRASWSIDNAARKAVRGARNQNSRLIDQLVRSSHDVTVQIGGLFRRAKQVEFERQDWERSVSLVGAKISLGLYFLHTKRIVPCEGIVTVLTGSNRRENAGEFYRAVLSLPHAGGLNMGKSNADSSFFYRFQTEDDEKCAIFGLVFYESIGVICKIYESEEKLDCRWSRSYRPSVTHGLVLVE